MHLKTLLTTLVLLSFAAGGARAETITLSVAASMTDAVNQLIAGFVMQHPEAKLQPNYGSSGSLAKQIDQGAPADLFLSANPKWMQYLADQKLIAPGSERVLAYNQLVFVGTTARQDLDLHQLMSLDRIALGSPDSVPAGQYARQAMDKAGVYAALEKAGKLVLAKDVRQALVYADRGEVDGAFVYRTDALLATRAKILFTVPGELYDRIAYPLGLTASGGEKPLARAFYDYLRSPEAVAILKKLGFEPAAN